MKKSTILIIVLVLGVIAAFYFFNKASGETETVNEKTTSTLSGLSSLFGGNGTNFMSSLFGKKKAETTPKITPPPGTPPEEVFTGKGK